MYDIKLGGFFIIIHSILLYSWLARTDPADVARVESKTVISTSEKRDTVPITAEGVTGALNKWISPSDMENAFDERFPGCMKGKYLSINKILCRDNDIVSLCDLVCYI